MSMTTETAADVDAVGLVQGGRVSQQRKREAVLRLLRGVREGCRTPWRIGSSVSKRVARAAVWMPTHSAERWSTATNTAACP